MISLNNKKSNNVRECKESCNEWQADTKVTCETDTDLRISDLILALCLCTSAVVVVVVVDVVVSVVYNEHHHRAIIVVGELQQRLLLLFHYFALLP